MMDAAESQAKKYPRLIEGVTGIAVLATGLLVWWFSPTLFSQGFVPHRYCYLARPDLIWTNVVTDSIIFLSYVSIFWSLLWVARRSTTLLLRTMVAFFVAFGIFILACGLTHLMEVIVIWFPFYWLSGTVKGITAVSSGITAFAFAAKKGVIVDGIAAYRKQLSTSEREREYAITALVNADKLAELGRLSASISHEINNPLEAVTNIVYCARTHPELPPELHELLVSADLELHRVADIAQNTLALYRESAAPRKVDLRKAIEGSIDLLGKGARDKGVQIATEFSGLLFIEAYDGGVRQILINLLRNAIEASEQNGEIRVSASPALDEATRRDGCQITVKDMGCGIPASAVPNLFRPTISTKQEGNGIGLWIVKQIVEKHGGTIAVESQTAKPSGTEFTVWLPVRFALGVLDTEELLSMGGAEPYAG